MLRAIYVVYSYAYACICVHMHNDHSVMTSDTLPSEKYTSHFIWKGCMWEGVGDRTELQHIDPHSIGLNRVSFPFSWAAQPRAWEPLWVLVFSNESFLQLVWSLNWLPVFTELYNCSTPTFLWMSQSPSFNLSTAKVIFWYSLSGCTCYLHRCISYFDSPAGW